MTKQNIIRASTSFAILVASFIAYYLLLHENFLHSSIAEIIDFAHSLEIHFHVLVLGFLPIYIALMISGAVMFGLYLGSRLQRLMLPFAKN